MKRLLFFLTFSVVAVCAIQANPVNASDARRVANRFFSTKSSSLSASHGQSLTRLAYTAEADRFYIFDRSEGSGFVVVAGDDRLPQVLGYSITGIFTPGNIPPAMQDWMTEMNREIAYLQSNSGVHAHKPIPQETAVGPLMTTKWSQDWPYNLYCPTYTVSNGGTERAVTGCVATAMTQIMNYYQWPLQGSGSHSYHCNVNDTDPTMLSADFSQSFYEWDKMLDFYDENSSEESCNAVAKLMSDAGISIDMNYGSSSGAQESAVMTAVTRYFDYSDKCYLLDRDLFEADEWDQFLFDEIAAGRPVLYCGYAYSQGSLGGHAFVFDGFDTNGYFHVNWGWGGTGDGYFLVSYLAPTSGNNFKYGQTAIFGFVPAASSDQVPDVLYVRGVMHPDMVSAPRGENVSVKFSDLYAEGNLLDTAGVENTGYWPAVYDLIPMELCVFDQNGTQQQSYQFDYRIYISGWGMQSPNIEFTPDASLADGEYIVKVAYSANKDGNYNSWVCDDLGNHVFCKMLLSNNMVYLSDCSLSQTYNLESMAVGQSIYAGEPFDVNVTLSYPRGWGPPPGGEPGGGPGGISEPSTTGNIRLMLKKNGEEVTTSAPMAISIPRDSTATFTLSMTAPAEWGRYELLLIDDSGRMFTPQSGWLEEADGSMYIVVVPVSDELIEDFETMQANNRTNDTNVPGRFTSWSFNKSGVRAPGEGRCNGTNSIMMKKPSAFYSVEPIYHNIFMAAITFFNNSTTEAKYTLEYSVDNAATWVKALTIDETDAASIPASSVTQAIWQLNIKANQPALFRVMMTGGGSAATYVDDFILRYDDTAVAGDVNIDGEVNIADVNAIIDMVINSSTGINADVNGDGEINIADINALIDMILGAN